MSGERVLVTGASGFIAKRCIAALLGEGFVVRGAVRDAYKADKVRAAVMTAKVDISQLSFVTADLDRDEGWQQAVEGCTYVLHTASPFPITQPGNRAAIVATARDGTLRVLKAAAKAGVKRVVLTSSTVSVMYAPNMPEGHLYTEADWTDASRADITPYMASKTLAERSAWDFAKSSDANGLELSVINPAFVQGPPLDDDLSTSLEVLRLMARGVYPASPRISFPVCDVRDVAAAHVKAMIEPRAAGERFIVAGGELPLIMLGRLMVEELPDLKTKAPKFEMPDIVVRALSIFDKRLRSVLPELGVVRRCSNEKIRRVLAINPRPAHLSVREGARKLRDLGVI